MAIEREFIPVAIPRSYSKLTPVPKTSRMARSALSQLKQTRLLASETSGVKSE